MLSMLPQFNQNYDLSNRKPHLHWPSNNHWSTSSSWTWTFDSLASELSYPFLRGSHVHDQAISFSRHVIVKLPIIYKHLTITFKVIFQFGCSVVLIEVCCLCLSLLSFAFSRRVQTTALWSMLHSYDSNPASNHNIQMVHNNGAGWKNQSIYI